MPACSSVHYWRGQAFHPTSLHSGATSTHPDHQHHQHQNLCSTVTRESISSLDQIRTADVDPDVHKVTLSGEAFEKAVASWRLHQPGWWKTWQQLTPQPWLSMVGRLSAASCCWNPRPLCCRPWFRPSSQTTLWTWVSSHHWIEKLCGFLSKTVVSTCTVVVS